MLLSNIFIEKKTIDSRNNESIFKLNIRVRENATGINRCIALVICCKNIVGAKYSYKDQVYNVYGSKREETLTSTKEYSKSAWDIRIDNCSKASNG